MNTSKDNAGVIVLPPVLYAVALGVVLGLRWWWPMGIFSGHAAAVRWAGVALVPVAFGIGAWGAVTLRKAGTNVNPMLPSTAIVANGPFAFSRNPLYVGLAIAFLGITLALDSWWGFIVLVPVIVLMHFGVVLREERYLAGKFGDAYRDYCTRVRRYF